MKKSFFVHLSRKASTFIPIFHKMLFLSYLNKRVQFVIFKPLNYSFEKTIGFYVKASLSSRPTSRLIRWYNKPGDLTKEFWKKKAIQFHETFHGLKITNWFGDGHNERVDCFQMFQIRICRGLFTLTSDVSFILKIFHMLLAIKYH